MIGGAFYLIDLPFQGLILFKNTLDPSRVFPQTSEDLSPSIFHYYDKHPKINQLARRKGFGFVFYQLFQVMVIGTPLLLDCGEVVHDDSGQELVDTRMLALW